MDLPLPLPLVSRPSPFDAGVAHFFFPHGRRDCPPLLPGSRKPDDLCSFLSSSYVPTVFGTVPSWWARPSGLRSSPLPETVEEPEG